MTDEGKAAWTDEDYRNAAAFGKCPIHRRPMRCEAFLDVADNGSVTQRYHHFCPSCEPDEMRAEHVITFEPRTPGVSDGD